MNIYIVEGGVFDGEDYNTWYVKAFRTREKAEEYAALAQAEAKIAYKKEQEILDKIAEEMDKAGFKASYAPYMKKNESQSEFVARMIARAKERMAKEDELRAKYGEDEIINKYDPDMRMEDNVEYYVGEIELCDE